MKKKMETSKKIAIFSAICFATILLFSMGMFAYNAYYSNQYDDTMLVTLITVAGAVFGTTCAFYYTKSKAENLYKMKVSFLKEKYEILNDFGALDEDRALQEMEEEFTKIEDDFNEDEDLVNEEITYNE